MIGKDLADAISAKKTETSRPANRSITRTNGVRRLRLDEGHRWTWFDGTAHSYASPLFDHPRNLAEYLCNQPEARYNGLVEWWNAAKACEAQVLTKSEVDFVFETTEALRKNIRVTDERLWRLFRLYEFLDETFLTFDREGVRFEKSYEKRYGDTFGDMVCIVSNAAWCEHHPGAHSITRKATQREKITVGSGMRELLESSGLIGSGVIRTPKDLMLTCRAPEYRDKTWHRSG